MNKLSTLILSAAACLLPSVNAHGFMSVPKSRNLLASERPWYPMTAGEPNSTPSGQNANGRRTNGLVYPPTSASARGHGLCGDQPLGNDACWTGGNCPEQHHMPGGKYYTPSPSGAGGAIQMTYLDGEEIDVSFMITAHHKGQISLRLCDEAHVTQECLDKYPPLERVAFEGENTNAQPINPAHPEMFYLNPKCYDDAIVANHGTAQPTYSMTARFKLPNGVTCENCVLQMWWITGNSCVPPGYDSDFSFPQTYDCTDGSAVPGAFVSATGVDCAGTDIAEEFWNCADISILPRSDDATTAAPATTAAAPATTAAAPATTAAAPATTAAAANTNCVAVWQTCGGSHMDGELCCEEGSQCFRQHEWYSQCRPSCPTGWECDQGRRHLRGSK